MSMPTTYLDCEKCGLRGRSSVAWGIFIYLLNGQEYPLNRALGWCFNCENFAPIEVFDASERTMALLPERAPRCLACGSTKIRQYDGDDSGLDPFDPDQKPIRTGFFHPGCSGEFIASLSRDWIRPRFDPKYYSLDGLPIED